MFKVIKEKSLAFSAAILVGTMAGAEDALAGPNVPGGESNVNFSSIAANVTESIAGLPGLLSGVAYMLGILLGVLGILKIKDHVENPGQTPLQHGAIRLTAGGGLFALPIVYEAMTTTIAGNDSGDTGTARLNAVEFGLEGGQTSP